MWLAQLPYPNNRIGIDALFIQIGCYNPITCRIVFGDSLGQIQHHPKRNIGDGYLTLSGPGFSIDVGDIRFNTIGILRAIFRFQLRIGNRVEFEPELSGIVGCYNAMCNLLRIAGREHLPRPEIPYR